MVAWLNRAVYRVARNGTTSHTVDPSSATGLVDGSTFTPTAGRKLVVVMYGGVTSTTPSGCTLSSGASAINNGGLYMWHRTAAGGDTFTTTHNGSDYTVHCAIYELPSTATFVGSVASTGLSKTAANPNLTGLTGSTNWVVGFKAQNVATTAPTGAITWTGAGSPVEDHEATFSRVSVPDNSYHVSLASVENYASASWQPTGTSTTADATTFEALTFAFDVPASTGVTGTIVSTFGSLSSAATGTVTAPPATTTVPVTHRGTGTHTGATAAVTAIAPVVPAGTVSGDLAVLLVGVKPYTVSITTPTGWTKFGEITSGTTVVGVDTGSTKAALYYRTDIAGGAAVPNIGQTGADSMGAVIVSYQKPTGSTWDVSEWTTGIDGTNGANISATGSAVLAANVNDALVGTFVASGDVGTVSAISLAATGVTGTLNTRINQAVTTGNDIRNFFVDILPITAGPASAAPVFSYSNANFQQGSAVFLRVRATAPLFTGVAVSTFASLSSDATGTHTAPTTGVTGTIVSTFGSLSSDAAGTFSPMRTGTIVSTFGSMSSAAAGTHTAPPNRTGTIVSTFGSLSSAAAGTFTPAPNRTGTIVSTFGSLASAAAGTHTAPANVTGTAVSTFDSLASAATGTVGAPGAITGTIVSTFGSLASVLAGTNTAPPTRTGTIVSTFGSLAAAAAGTHTAPPNRTGTIVSTFGSLSSAAAGTYTAAPTRTGTIVSTFGSLGSALTGTHVAPIFSGTIVSTFGGMLSLAAGYVLDEPIVVPDFPRVRTLVGTARGTALEGAARASVFTGVARDGAVDGAARSITLTGASRPHGLDAG